MLQPAFPRTTNDSPRNKGFGGARSHLIGAGVIGFALGGFFDGILLHQVLQWHHFLSLVEAQWASDIRVQILADGLFHVAVYIVAAAGLWML